ncbi:MAG: ABC transporter permease [Halobacteriales archaeon]
MSTEQSTEDVPLADRLRRNPRPAALWLLGLAALIALEFGAFFEFVMSLAWDVPVSWLTGALPAGPVTAVAAALAAAGNALADVPTLLTRSIFENQGYYVPGTGWRSTFLDLSPATVWSLRVTLVYAYAFGFLWWLWRGYLTFRRHYRVADWTPTDDIIDRLSRHRWGQFGLVVVVAFLVLATFAPALSPATFQENIRNPYGSQVEYYDEETDSVETVTGGSANLDSKSVGARSNVGIWSYDIYGRFHPVGTLTTGKDLMTFLAYGARVSLFIGLLASAIAGGIALLLALLTAYYKGLADLATVVTSDAFAAMPQLLVLIMLSTVLAETWIAKIYSGAFLLAVLFGIWGWMYLWRAVRGPAFQVVENEWVDAAESFGERPTVLVRKHVAPYVIGYLLIYLSMSLGGYIIGAAGLSYLGLGVLPPTPEWGRAVAQGQSFIATRSWHISIIPGVAITIIVLGFNALGDGIRDAIDPQSEGGEAVEAAAGGTGA